MSLLGMLMMGSFYFDAYSGIWAFRYKHQKIVKKAEAGRIDILRYIERVDALEKEADQIKRDSRN